MMELYWGEGHIAPFYYVEDYAFGDEYYAEYGCLSVQARNCTEADTDAYFSLLAESGCERNYDEDYGIDYTWYNFDEYTGLEIQVYFDAFDVWNIDFYYFDETPYIPPVDAPTDWTDDEKAMFATYFGEYTFPFIYIDNYVLTDSYYSYYDCLCYEAPNGNTGMIITYTNILTENGFDVFLYQGTYLGIKEIGNFSLYADTYVNESGYFTIDFYVFDETPKTNWSEEELELMETYWGEGIAIPFFAGSNAEFTDEYYEYYGTLDYSCTATDTCVEEYKEIVEAAGYATSEKASSSYVGYDATYQFDNGYVMELSFYTYGSYFYIEAYLKEPANVEWPTDAIAEFIGGNILPSFTWSGYFYTIESNKIYMTMECPVTADREEDACIALTETVYLAAMEAAGWTIDGSEYDMYGYVCTYDLDEAYAGIEVIFYWWWDVFYIFINK